MIPFSLRLVALSLAIIGVAGCGESREASTSTTGTTATAPAATGAPVETVEISETDFALDPADPVVSKSGVIEFVAENDGEVDHALEVEGATGEAETEVIAPGDSASLKIELPPGEYKMYCPVGDHEQRGMVGTVTVEEG
jgi:uncharacterized cupredoxin-like copper-binding protein